MIPAVLYAAIAVLIIAVCAGLVWLIFWSARRSREALAALGRCDWCDGFTTDRRKCRCTDPCTFVPQCQARIRIPGGPS